jgi:uncharacterized protein YqiB (DUF1249 family)
MSTLRIATIDPKVFTRNYQKLLKLAPDLWSLKMGEALKSKSEGYMDLNLDVLNKEGHQLWVALSHYYQHPSGDLIPDPNMEIRISSQCGGYIEALTYQDSFGYQRVYLDENRYYPKLRKSLNSFLGQWLKNCLEQGHRLVKTKEAS